MALYQQNGQGRADIDAFGDDNLLHRRSRDGHRLLWLAQGALHALTDILVVGAVARGLLDQILVGSTIERILDELHADLLVIKPADFVCPVTA